MEILFFFFRVYHMKMERMAKLVYSLNGTFLIPCSPTLIAIVSLTKFIYINR